MIIVSQFRNKKIGIVGLGRTGIACLISLLSVNCRVYVLDDTIQSLNSIKIPDDKYQHLMDDAISAGLLSLNDLPNTLDAMVISPGIPDSHAAFQYCSENNIPIYSDFDLLYLACPSAEYIGITGTNGKSTTTALIGHILKSNAYRVEVGGNIGVACLNLKPLTMGGSYVLECSSFQLDLISEIRFNIAVFLNLTPDHLDRHHNIEAYQNAKMKIFSRQSRDNFAIVSVDTPIMGNIGNKLLSQDKQNIIPISTDMKLKYGISVINNVLYDNLDINWQHRFKLNNLKHLLGRHNSQNIAAAYCVAKLKGINEKKIIDSIESFQGLPHRMELVLEKGAITFVNDSKATNTDASEKALMTFDNIVWIAGGISKDEGIEVLSHLFKKLQHVFLIGKSAQDFAKVLLKYGVGHTISGTLEQALIDINEAKFVQGVVLLSPACASFDQWKSYEHRGEAFKNIVRQMFL